VNKNFAVMIYVNMAAHPKGAEAPGLGGVLRQPGDGGVAGDRRAAARFGLEVSARELVTERSTDPSSGWRLQRSSASTPPQDDMVRDGCYVATLEAEGILRETTGQARNRVYMADAMYEAIASSVGG